MATLMAVFHTANTRTNVNALMVSCALLLLPSDADKENGLLMARHSS